MSVFGGDSWAREAQHRKRKVDDLMLSASSLSSNKDSSPSFKKLSNGKYACLVCPHNPILDTPLVLSMHNKGSRHMAAESRMRARELSRKEELNKRIALCSDSTGISNPGSSMVHTELSKCHDKPLLEKTRKAIIETKFNQDNRPNSVNVSQNANLGGHSNRLQSKSTSKMYGRVGLEQSVSYDNHSSYDNLSVSAMNEAVNKTNWGIRLRERQEKELKFTAAGWKRDCHGKWYRDENVEFDSDEEDPNLSLT